LQQTDNPQQLLTNAALQPKLYENLNVHLFKHALWMNSADFDSLPFEVQQNAFTHYQETIQRLYSIPQLPTPQPVKTSLSLRATVDPTTAAQILDRSGVPEASPENLSQLPLDTTVTDYLGEGTHGSGGGSANTPLDNVQQVQGMVHAQDAHDMNQAKAAHDMALAQAKAEHEQAIAKAKAELARKQAKAPVSKGSS
jgi:hypothetical protein